MGDQENDVSFELAINIQEAVKQRLAQKNKKTVQLNDLLKDTKFTKSEIRQMYRGFKQVHSPLCQLSRCCPKNESKHVLLPGKKNSITLLDLSVLKVKAFTFYVESFQHSLRVPIGDKKSKRFNLTTRFVIKSSIYCT